MNGLPAYGIRLLEQHALPGLQAQLVESRTNADLRPIVRERINSLTPDTDDPLYQQLTRLDYTPVSMMTGLKKIITALGIEDKPYRA